jgi:hypothetical protein
MKEKLLQGLNLLLVGNIFLVLFSFAWFVVAVVGRAANVPLGFDLWYRLWQPVFTPAIGILMAGAILSGVIAQVKKRLSPRSD